MKNSPTKKEETLNHELVIEQLPQQFPTVAENVYGRNKNTIIYHRGQIVGNRTQGLSGKRKITPKTPDEKNQLKTLKKSFNSDRPLKLLATSRLR